MPLLEAAACKLPIIATNWSGHLDFLKLPDSTEKLFSTVAYSLKPIPEAAVWEPLLVKDSQWAVVNEDDAIRRMQMAVANTQKPREWANKLYNHVRENFSISKTQKDFLTLLNQFITHNAIHTGNPEAIENWLKSHIDDADAYNILYTMPMSTGDVFLSTAIIDSVFKEASKENDKVHVYFATQPQFASVLEGNPQIHKVIQWNEAMMNISALEDVFDRVLTPNIPTQFVFSNWVRSAKADFL